MESTYNIYEGWAGSHRMVQGKLQMKSWVLSENIRIKKEHTCGTDMGYMAVGLLAL